MKKTVLSLAVGIAVGAAGVAIAGRPADDDRIETLRLKSITPSSVVRLLTQPAGPTPSAGQNKGTITHPLLPAGIRQVNPDDPRGTLTLRGDAESRKRVRDLVAMLDLPPNGVRLPIRIWRMEGPVESPNAPRRLVATAVTQTVNNQMVEAVAVGDAHVFQVRLVPHLNGDKTVTLAVSFASTPLGVPLVRFPEHPHATRVVRPGATARLTATFIQKRQDSGSRLPSPFDEPKFGYLLEVTPETVRPSNIRVPIW
jgi:hypothetical protein